MTDSNFPVTWEDPADAQRLWRFERWHNPRPIAPLSFGFNRHIYIGFARGQQAVGRLTRTDVRRINCYVYLSDRDPAPNDPAATADDPQPQRLDNHETWERRWLPEIQGYLADWERFHEGPAPTAAELLSHLNQAMVWFERAWEIHDRLEVSVRTLQRFVERVLGWDKSRAHVLLGGTENLSLVSDDALRRLAGLARQDPETVELFSRAPAEELQDALVAAGADALLAGLANFLGRFSHKSDNFMELSLPTWREDSTPVLALLKLYVSQPQRDHHAVRDRLTSDREAAEAEARHLLRNKPPELLDEFQRELTFCREAVALTEDHNYWIDQQVMYWTRMDMLAAGRLLATAGVIERVDDVFLLKLDEVSEALHGGNASRAAIVRERKAEMERWAGVGPPSELGDGTPGMAKDDFAPLFGELDPFGTDQLIRGMPASMGVVTGRARVIGSIADAEKLREGEILIVETTSPPWTPLFGIAGALVTDGGGPLSHAAIVAREYGIAAVVGTVSGTRLIRDGQLVRVDGAAGTVELLEK